MGKMMKKIFVLLLWGMLTINLNTIGYARDSGFIWIKSYNPGSANPNDETIDKVALARVDSLMKRNDIDIIFLGGADRLRWKSLPQKNDISTAFDQAKKLERASLLRERYGWGEIGITDEPVRGVKVVWTPKKPDPFKLKSELFRLKSKNDSLMNFFKTWKNSQRNELAAIHDSLRMLNAEKNSVTVKNEIKTSYFDWEIKTGLLSWTAGGSHDLIVPSVGIALRREYWTFEFEGGFTPWSKPHVNGNRGDALVVGTFTMFPQKNYEVKTGIFSGWEFLSSSDEWTMKVMGVICGPSFKWKFIEGFVGYTLARVSTLTIPEKWTHGLMINTNFKILMK